MAEDFLLSGRWLNDHGVTESQDNRGEEFGEQRLIEAIRRRLSLPIHDLAASVSQEVLDYSSSRQSDDLTLILARKQ